MRTVHTLVQGSSEWLAFRASVDGSASEAAAMLGISSYKSRDELIREKATGIRQEVDARTQERFNKGHHLEEMARVIAERFIQEDLYPATYSIKVDGLLLSASCDGLTIDDEIAWEHKSSNAALREALAQGVIPEEYHPQLEQVSMCTGANKVLFTASNGTEESALHVWYTPNHDLRARIIAGWKQFKIDVANYVYVEPTTKPIGQMIESLPALFVDVAGSLTTKSNLAEFRTGAELIISSIKTELETDQDFADADTAIKWLDGAEKRIDAAIEAAMAKSGPLEEIVRTLKDVQQNLFRTTRLNLNKQVESQKTARKTEIVVNAQSEWKKHVDTCNAALGSVRLPEISVDFAGAIKGKRTLDTLRSAANDELARAKIEANRLVNHIDANLCLLREIASKHAFLFSDRQQLVLKDKDAVEAIARQRISEHESAEKARIEAEAQRIDNERAEQEKQSAVVQPVYQEYPTKAIDDAKVYTSDREEVAAAMIPAVTQRQVFTLDEPEPLADMSDFFRGKHTAFKIALDRYRECAQSGADFEEILQSLIQATKPVNKAA